MRDDVKIPIENKFLLTLDEAAEYFNIGKNKLREITDDPNFPGVIWIGTKRLIKRQKMELFLAEQYSL